MLSRGKWHRRIMITEAHLLFSLRHNYRSPTSFHDAWHNMAIIYNQNKHIDVWRLIYRPTLRVRRTHRRVHARARTPYPSAKRSRAFSPEWWRCRWRCRYSRRGLQRQTEHMCTTTREWRATRDQHRCKRIGPATHWARNALGPQPRRPSMAQTRLTCLVKPGWTLHKPRTIHGCLQGKWMANRLYPVKYACTAHRTTQPTFARTCASYTFTYQLLNARSIIVMIVWVIWCIVKVCQFAFYSCNYRANI